VRLRSIEIRSFVMANNSSVALAAKPTSLGAGISIQGPTANHSTSMVPPPRRRFSPDVSLTIVANGLAPRALNDEMTNCSGELFALE
jgi:hypothetical protein